MRAARFPAEWGRGLCRRRPPPSSRPVVFRVEIGPVSLAPHPDRQTRWRPARHQARELDGARRPSSSTFLTPAHSPGPVQSARRVVRLREGAAWTGSVAQTIDSGRGGAGRGGRGASTSTEVRRVDVPFSYPSEVYPQKDERKIRWCCEGTFTFRPVPYGRRGAAPARSLRGPSRPALEAGAGGLRRPVGSSGRLRRGGGPISAKGVRGRVPGCGPAAGRRRC